jgi:hypothetical protein
MSNESKNIDEEYSIDFLARFACLYEGVNVACARAERLGYDTERSNVWIKPTALQKYIEERFLDMKYDMQQFKKGINTDEVYPWDKVY